MARTAAERMAGLRARQRDAGLVTLTLVVPAEDVDAFRTLARRRRDDPRGPARGRRGPPSLAAAPRRLSRRRSAIRPQDIMRLRELLEVAALGLACASLTVTGARRLRAVVDWEQGLDADASGGDLQRLHALLGELSGDPTLQFLLTVALRLTDEHASFSGRPRRERAAGVARIRRIHAGIVEAIVARNAGLAESRLRRYLAGLREWLD